MRENHPEASGAKEPVGARRTLSFVIGRENQTDVGALAKRFVAPETLISADKSDAYDLLHGHFPMRRVNHQREYLANYANEAAYREDTRRLSNGEIFRDILTKCARTHTHRDWCGYWQGNKRLEERLAA